MEEVQLEYLVKKVLENMNIDTTTNNNVSVGIAHDLYSFKSSDNSSDSELSDLGSIDFRKEFMVPNASNLETYMKMKKSSPARLGIWRAGPRYTTRTMLRFRADHATAQDSVFKEVPDNFASDNNLFTIQTRCSSKDVFLTRPDLGRRLSDEGVNTLKDKSVKSPRVLVYVADGLSSVAITTNAITTLKSIEQSLKSSNITLGTPFFVKYGRVAVMDEIAEILDVDVICTLIGERPGLITSESMSCYMAYRPTIGMPESKRTVVSNIHSGGMPALEAGAYIADIVLKMLDQKASGIDLK